jgi:hypothetical protein
MFAEEPRDPQDGVRRSCESVVRWVTSNETLQPTSRRELRFQPSPFGVEVGSPLVNAQYVIRDELNQ